MKHKLPLIMLCYIAVLGIVTASEDSFEVRELDAATTSSLDLAQQSIDDDMALLKAAQDKVNSDVAVRNQIVGQIQRTYGQQANYCENYATGVYTSGKFVDVQVRGRYALISTRQVDCSKSHRGVTYTPYISNPADSNTYWGDSGINQPPSWHSIDPDDIPKEPPYLEQ